METLTKITIVCENYLVLHICDYIVTIDYVVEHMFGKA